MDDGKAPKSLHKGEGLLGRGDDVSLVEMADELGDDFGVGFGVELDIVGLEHLAERAVVFDDAVMDDSDAEMLIKMGMGILAGGFSMRGPAGMRDGQGEFSGCFRPSLF